MGGSPGCWGSSLGVSGLGPGGSWNMVVVVGVIPAPLSWPREAAKTKTRQADRTQPSARAQGW